MRGASKHDGPPVHWTATPHLTMGVEPISWSSAQIVSDVSADALRVRCIFSRPEHCKLTALHGDKEWHERFAAGLALCAVCAVEWVARLQ